MFCLMSIYRKVDSRNIVMRFILSSGVIVSRFWFSVVLGDWMGFLLSGLVSSSMKVVVVSVVSSG